MSRLPTSRTSCRSDTMGFVYFITVEPDRYVKIGWTLHHPDRRLNELQTGCPHPLRLMAFAPGTLDEEKQLHRLFADLNYRSEWFFNYPPIEQLIVRLSDGFPKPTINGATRQEFFDAVAAVEMHDEAVGA